MSQPALSKALSKPQSESEAAAADQNVLHWAQALISARAALKEFLPPDLFGDPALQILLELFVARGEGRAIDVTRCYQRAGLPLTTTLRWLTRLGTRNLVQSSADGEDDRRRFVELTTEGAAAIEAWLRRTIQPMEVARGRLSDAEIDILFEAEKALADQAQIRTRPAPRR